MLRWNAVLARGQKCRASTLVVRSWNLVLASSSWILLPVRLATILGEAMISLASEPTTIRVFSFLNTRRNEDDARTTSPFEKGGLKAVARIKSREAIFLKCCRQS